MKIGVDLDGVLGNQVPHLLRRVKQEYGISMKKNDIRLWNQPMGGTDFENEMEKALLDNYFIMAMPIIRGCREAMQKIASRHCIVIVTNRPPETNDTTCEWLRKRRLKFHQFLNTRASGKASIPVDILIDDNLQNVRDFALTNRRAVLLSQPWNRDPAPIAQLLKEGKVVCARNWKEIADIISTSCRCKL